MGTSGSARGKATKELRIRMSKGWGAVTALVDTVVSSLYRFYVI
jgi:hypothetical protein